MKGLIIDNFAGGGGASTGIELALGRPIDVAINHDPEAVAMHKANHPQTEHYCQSVWKADPLEVTQGRPVSLAWFSPDCKHFSKAKGGKPRAKHIRDLAWVVVMWAQRVRPAVIMLENVEEFRTWGPLDEHGNVIRARAGETFEKWTKELRKLGYKIQWKELRACDYGAPTSRKRFFMIARCDGKPIVWPEPTHGKPGTPEVESGQRLPWRTAAEIIDWSIQCPSIFERKKQLKDATCRRIAAGIVRFVLNNPRPFIVPITHSGGDGRVHDSLEPVRTITTAHRGELAMVSPVIVGCGGRRGQSGPVDPQGPYPTTTAKADAILVAPYFARTAHGEVDKNGKKRGKGQHPVDETFPTVTASQDSALIAASLVQTGYGERLPTYRCLNCDDLEPWTDKYSKGVGTLSPPECPRCGEEDRIERVYSGQAPRALDPEAPLGTIVAGGGKHAAVAAFLSKFSENSVGTKADEPIHTVMAGAPRHAVVTAHIAQHNGGPRNQKIAGREADSPISTISSRGTQQQLVTGHMVKLQNNQGGKPVDEPIGTIMAGGLHFGEVRAFLTKYYGSAEHGQQADRPLDAVTAKARFGLVTVTIDGEEYAIADIGMRMLTPRELFAAQGFPPDYDIEAVEANGGKPLTKTSQIAKCGNSVCPDLSRALVAANFAEEIAAQERAAA